MIYKWTQSSMTCTEKSVVSILFFKFELTNTPNWLKSLWLTGERLHHFFQLERTANLSLMAPGHLISNSQSLDDRVNTYLLRNKIFFYFNQHFNQIFYLPMKKSIILPVQPELYSESQASNVLQLNTRTCWWFPIISHSLHFCCAANTVLELFDYPSALEPILGPKKLL